MSEAGHYAHIALYYNLKWRAHHCIAWNLLRFAYKRMAEGSMGPLERDFLA